MVPPRPVPVDFRRVVSAIVTASLGLGASSLGCGPCYTFDYYCFARQEDDAGGDDVLCGALVGQDDSVPGYLRERAAQACGADLACVPPGTYDQEGEGDGCAPAQVEGRTALRCTDVYECKGGRRPAGFVAAIVPESAHVVGAFFSRLAQLEAASIVAFRHLARELHAHHAPPSLVTRAARSARDEARHARLVGTLALRYGANPRPPRVPRIGVRPLDVVARDNAVEGCVHELYGALVALWQAYAARDPAVRTTMRSIALDEARHAALAWDVGRWADGELPAAQRRAVRRHRRDAAFALFSRVPVEPPPELVRDAGLPDGASAARLAALVSEATG